MGLEVTSESLLQGRGSPHPSLLLGGAYWLDWLPVALSALGASSRLALLRLLDAPQEGLPTIASVWCVWPSDAAWFSGGVTIAAATVLIGIVILTLGGSCQLT